jgi:hypothetical protein
LGATDEILNRDARVAAIPLGRADPRIRPLSVLQPFQRRNFALPSHAGRPTILLPAQENRAISAVTLDVPMKDEEQTIGGMERIKLEDAATNGTAAEMERTGSTATPGTGEAGSQSPPSSVDDVKPTPGDNVETPGSSKAPSLSRKASRKAASREPRVYGDFPDATRDACEHFQVIPDCLYGSKNMGATDNDAFDCECRDEWRT